MNYQKIYNTIIQRATDRSPIDGYVERHHIVPRCVGGSNAKSNIATLTPEEHFLCHLLLVKIYPHEPKLLYAANRMCCGHVGKRSNRKLYGWVKRKFSQQRSMDSLGAANTQHGTIWINRIGTTDNRRILASDPLPEGWQFGRQLKLRPQTYCPVCGNQKPFSNKYCGIGCKTKANRTHHRIKLTDDVIHSIIAECKQGKSVSKSLKDHGFHGSGKYHAKISSLLTELYTPPLFGTVV